MTAVKLRSIWATMGRTDVLGFYSGSSGKFACFSNFYDQTAMPFTFVIPYRITDTCGLQLDEKDRAVKCNFSEKAIMLCKAAAMGDRRHFNEIRSAQNPRKAKQLGR